MPPLPRLALASLLPLLGGCGMLSAGADPAVIAFRGGAGYWPENSRHALGNVVLQPYDGVELDVAVTSDGIPVLNRGPWLAADICTTPDETPLAEHEIRVMDYSFADLEDGFRCGVFPDQHYPDAVTVKDSVMPLDEALGVLSGNSGYLVQLNVIYDKGNTPEPEVVAQSILDTWYDIAPENRFFLSAPSRKMIDALDSHAADLGRPGEIETSLVWPEMNPDGFVTGTLIGNEIAQSIGLADVMGAAWKANSDGVALPLSLLDRQLAHKLQSNGIAVQVWGADGHSQQGALRRWPVDVVITAYPEPAP